MRVKALISVYTSNPVCERYRSGQINDICSYLDNYQIRLIPLMWLPWYSHNGWLGVKYQVTYTDVKKTLNKKEKNRNLVMLCIFRWLTFFILSLSILEFFFIWSFRFLFSFSCNTDVSLINFFSWAAMLLFWKAKENNKRQWNEKCFINKYLLV